MTIISTWTQAVRIAAEYVTYTETDGNDEPTPEQVADYQAAIAFIAGKMGHAQGTDECELLAERTWGGSETPEEVKTYLAGWAEVMGYDPED